MRDMDTFTKTGALKIVETELGFPNPSKKGLTLYFDINDDGMYEPRVNFITLKKALDKKELVAKMGSVVELSKTHQRRQAVELEIRNVVKKHEL